MVHRGKPQSVRGINWKIQGISSVEMAIVLPVLLLLVFGMIQFGLGWRVSQVITNAAREGARYGVVVSDPSISDSMVKTQVQNYLKGSGLDGSLATITVACTTNTGVPVIPFTSCTVSNYQVSVTVSLPVTNLIPNILPFFPPTLTAAAVMRHE